jgi:uncharacterized RDD family membrane protein YckC
MNTAGTQPSADEHLTLGSATGVDLDLKIAGPGSRSYAFVIDWHVRFLLACTWLLIAVYLFHVNLGSPLAPAALGAEVPAAAIYFLYHPIIEVIMRGRSPGKRIAGLVLVDQNGGTPGTAAILIRNVFRLIDSLPAFYLVGLVSCFITERRVRIGDIAAGTLLIIEDAEAQESLARIQALAAGSSLPLPTLELLDQVIDRWAGLEEDKRIEFGRKLIVRIGGVDPASLAALTDDQLLARLQRLRGGQPGTAAGRG